MDTCGPDKCRGFGDVKNSCASPAVRGNRPSPNIARIAVAWFTRDVVMHLRMMPKLLSTCSIMIPQNGEEGISASGAWAYVVARGIPLAGAY